MAQNLVPLFLDKASGEIVAAKNNTNNGVGNPHNPTTPSLSGYEHKQLSPLSPWVIVHNGDTERLICQIYDENNKLIFADDVEITNSNIVTITFSVAQSGSAKIIFF